MKVTKNELKRSQVELLIELDQSEFAPYIEKGAAKVSKEVKIEGFRPGKAPHDVVKRTVGEMTVLEEAAHLAVNATLGQAIEDNIGGRAIGRPEISVTKLAPGNPFEYKALIALMPSVTLGEYKNLGVKQAPAKVEEAEIDKIIGELREMRVQEAAAERELREGDKALLDIRMFLDKVPLDGGQSKDTAVVLGKEYIVPGFDKQVLGLGKGETREFSLPYPPDFHMKNLAGKLVEFAVTLKDLFERKLPDLDESFASGFGAKSVEELRANIRKSLAGQKERESAQAAEREILEKAVANARFGDMPEILIESEAHNLLHDIEHSVEEQGGKFADYLSHLGKTHDQFKLDLLPDAVKRIKVNLLIREISIKEGVKAEDREAEEHIRLAKSAAKDKPEVLGRLNSPEYRAYVVNYLTSQKVVEKLKEWNLDGVNSK